MLLYYSSTIHLKIWDSKQLSFQGSVRILEHGNTFSYISVRNFLMLTFFKLQVLVEQKVFETKVDLTL